MAKMKRKINPDPEPREEIDKEEYAENEVLESGEISEHDIPMTDLGLKDWFLKNNFENTEYRVSLYRFLNPAFGEKKSLIYQWSDELPTEHEIGLKYGSGRYCLYVCLTDKTGRRRIYNSKLRISDEYDKIKNGVSSEIGTAGSSGNINSMDSAFQMVAKVVALIAPLMHSNNNDSTARISDVMLDSYKNMNEVLKQNTIDNTQFMNDLQRKVNFMPEVVETENEVSGLTGFINSIAPLIEKFLPMISDRQNVTSRAAVGVLKTMPQYAEVVKDKAKLKALINFVSKKHGQETCNKVLKNLGIKV
jgi:hypothetical protein